MTLNAGSIACHANVCRQVDDCPTDNLNEITELTKTQDGILICYESDESNPCHA